MSSNATNQNVSQSSCKSIIESIIICGASLFFIGSSFYSHDFSKDFYSDYIVFGYSLIVLLILILHSANEKIVCNIINSNFGIISTLRGKGLLLLCISLQYLKVKYTLQKLSVVVLLILSIYLILIEWLYPTNIKKESQSSDNKNNNQNQSKHSESNNTTALDKTEEEKNKSKDNPYNIPDDF